MSLDAPISRRSGGEPTLPLINIVFLMLIFFLVAAQMARPIDPSLTLVQTDDPDLVPPPDALVVLADGRTLFRGRDADAAATVETLRAAGEPPLNIRILPDARVDATVLIGVAQELRTAGADAVFIVTERALQ